MAKPDEKKTTEELFREYRETKLLELRNEIVERHFYIAEILARKYTGRGVDYDDLFQVSSYALVLAVMRYDPDKNVQFASFATPTIIGEIKKHFRDTMWSLKVPRRLKEISMKILEARGYLQEENGWIPTVPELAKHLGISDEEVTEALESSRAYTTYSLDHEAEDAEGDAPGYDKYLGDEEKGYENFENTGVLEKVMADLSPTEKEVIKKRFLQEITQNEVAKSLGISQMTVSRIEKALKDKFRAEYYK